MACCRALAWRLSRTTSRRTLLLSLLISGGDVSYACAPAQHTVANGLLQGIGMEVVAYDIQKNPAVEAMGVKYVALEQALLCT